MKLTYTDENITDFKNKVHNGYFVMNCKFAEKDIVKKAGFWWNPGKKCWWTPFEKVAANFADVADVSIKDRMMTIKNDGQATVDVKRNKIKASKATNAEIDIPVPDGLKYLPFQKAGIAYARDHRNVLIADEMGLGKTIQALGIMNDNPEIKKTLCVVPASLKLNWKREAEKWLVRDTDISVIRSKDGWVDGDLVIINYDILKKFHNEIHNTKWDLLVCDESHYLKNGKSQRTKEIVGWFDKNIRRDVEYLKAGRKLFLTGTPIVNRPIELWTLVHFLAPKTFFCLFNKYNTGYAQKFCAPKNNGYGWDLKGASNLDKLQEMLRTSVMVRRLKKDVLKELPAKFRQVIEVPANGHTAVVKREQKVLAENAKTIDYLKLQVELAKASENPEDYKNAVAALKEGVTVAFSEMSQVRHETALAKVDVVVEHLKGIIEDDEQKVICFAHHRDVIEKIESAFGDKCVKLYGGMSEKAKQDAVDRFQDDDNVKLFIGSIQAAGVGITLTAANKVVFAELDWVPGNMTQAEDRAHRIGQFMNVLVQHIVLEGSMDVEMAHKLIAKQEVIDNALDKDHGSEDELVITPGDESGTSNYGRDRSGQIADDMTVHQREAVQRALRTIAGMCDGAREEDGVGFNKIDTRVGKELAQLQDLSPRQAALGKIIALKYHRQISDELVAEIKG
jgi:SWI/SNF-related matrix-associated actin-dependent regulator 1 of chromatin subfamily A